jgi:catechol 2,3-dioxygenase
MAKTNENKFRAKIGHGHIKVRDLNRAIAFYTQFLNLKVTEIVGGSYAFLTSGELHHDLALQAVGPNAADQHPYGIGLFHIAFEVPDAHSLAQAYKALTDGGIAVATVDHLISWAIYFDDPDGNGLEIYWDTRKEPNGTDLWYGRNEPLPREKLLDALNEVKHPVTR